MEWLDTRRNAVYTEDDSPSVEVYKSWQSDSMFHRMFLADRFIDELVDFGENIIFKARLSGALRSGKGRRQWEAEKVKRVAASTPREEAIKEILVNLLLY